MNIVLPCRNSSFKLTLKIVAKNPINIFIRAQDANRANTFYIQRKGKVEGSRTFVLKFPLSPKEMTLMVFNPAVGNKPIGEDDSFEIKDVQVTELMPCNTKIWLNKQDREFLKFAAFFAEKAKVLKSGKSRMNPQTYLSDNRQFRIDYYDKIYDVKSKEFLTTPARVHHNTGMIEVSKKHIWNYSVPMIMIILLHEYSHFYKNRQSGKAISNEPAADVNALYLYLGMGFSPLESQYAFLHVFKEANNEANHKRMKIINDFTNKFVKGKVIESCRG